MFDAACPHNKFSRNLMVVVLRDGDFMHIRTHLFIFIYIFWFDDEKKKAEEKVCVYM